MSRRLASRAGGRAAPGASRGISGRFRDGASGAVRTIAPCVVVGAWLLLFHGIGRQTWGYGRLTFVRMGLVVALVLGARLLRRRPLRAELARALGIVGLILAVALALHSANVLRTRLSQEEIRDVGIDIARNVYVAGGHALAGRNPYREVSQLDHVIEPGPHVTLRGRDVFMYGLPYSRGFPYFPMMFLGYLPFRWLAPAIHSMRWANGLFLAASALGAFWLARRLATDARGRSFASWAVVAYLGVSTLPNELFGLAVTDVLIAVFAVYGYVAASYGRWVLSGALLGCAQASKFLPGPLLVVPLLVHLGARRPSFRVALAYLATTGAIVLPFVIPDPARFVSSTILYYLTHHAAGDDTSLYWFLPEPWKAAFSTLGLLLTCAAAVSPRWRRGTSLAAPATAAFLSYFVFTAFNKMTHLNYVWGVFAIGCAALVARATETCAAAGGSGAAPAPPLP